MGNSYIVDYRYGGGLYSSGDIKSMNLLDLCIGVGLIVMCVAGLFYLNVKDNELIERYRNRDNGDGSLRV